MPDMPSDLDCIYQEAIFSLECPESHSYSSLFFQSTEENHDSCFMHLNLPQSTVPGAGNIKCSLALFEVIGQIAAKDCYLTKFGDEWLFPEDEESKTAYSCWIEPRCADMVSLIHWRNVARGLDMIVVAAPAPIETIHTIRADPETDSVKIQVSWRPLAGQTVEDTFPLYDSAGNRRVPASEEEVPFGQPVHVLFHLECVMYEGIRYLFAHLLGVREI
ncbi:hypothetical protein SCP_1400880 [Sparassis crispa]|uniref:Uncharacterized protein n=1 Tax=Sparassis crispa TaxID=139825 RepID=A0A401H2R3_9APHY|nr:hypothetical protein SCP_1400880 [Sparassis crispa]GBE88683.1 hypothetical protein SCP_1400880 [Sparassis crispa]